ncbi:tyrosine-type recombinase/integrase [Paenibacillus sp. FSL K6-0276]|uniref:tyrosine-type recombinase/integrase n=1 Tax=Paenibacillus sp. FSL K6-0276 TaxID=2921450 RepID=UPI0030EEE432
MKGKVFKRGKTWTYVVDLPPDQGSGKRNQKKKGGFGTQKEADRALVSLLASVDKGDYVAEINLTVADFFDIWLKDYALQKYKSTVYDVEESIIRSRIVPVIGRHKLQQIKPLTINRFYNGLLEKYSSDYVRHIHAILRKAFGQAVKWEMLVSNPIDKVEAPKLRRKEMKTWTMEQCLHFLDIAKGHVHYIVYSLAIHTGMRKGEVLGLRWSDIDFEAKSLMIQQTVNWTPSKGIIIQDTKTSSSARRIPIGNMLIADLKHRKQIIDADKQTIGTGHYKDHDLVCSYANGEPIKPRRVTETFSFLTGKSELPKIRFHDLRHSHASMLLNNGINAKIGAERLGHSSVQIYLDRYSHLLPDMQRDAADLIDSKMQMTQIPITEPTP